MKRELSDTSAVLQRAAAAKPAPLPRLASLPHAITEEEESAEAALDDLPDPRMMSKGLLAAGVVLCSRSNGGSRYEVIRLAGGTLPVVDAFAERKGSRSSYWSSEQRKKVFIRALTVRPDDRRLSRAKATLEAFRRMQDERLVKVHDNMLIRGKERSIGSSNSSDGPGACYCVVMER